MGRRVVSRVGVLVVAAFVAVSCADAYGQEMLRRDDLILWRQTQRGPADGMTAIVAGPVTVNEAGCVMLGGNPVVWPTGTTFASTDPLRLRFDDGKEVEQGVEVSGTGGFLKPEDLEITIPLECRPTDEDVAVFNPQSQLRIGPPESDSDASPRPGDSQPATEPAAIASASYPPCGNPTATTPWGSDGLVEAQPAAEGLEAWALLWRAPPWPIDAEIKLVVSLTGTGEFTAIAVGPDGTELNPSWGPNAHSASNFNRPGDEWGLAFSLPTAGCWQLIVGRDTGSASLAINVIADR